MSLVTDLSQALDRGTLTPELAARWQSDEAQAAWNEETNTVAMARLCAYSDLVLGVRVACACMRSQRLLAQENRAVLLAEQWASGEEVSRQELQDATAAVRGSSIAALCVVSAVASAETGAILAADALAAAYNVSSSVIYAGNATYYIPSRSAVPSLAKRFPSITFCNECHRPATYLRQHLSPRMTRPDERTQAHWRVGQEEACRPSRIRAERVRAGLSPISLTFEKQKIVEGVSGLEQLEEAAASSGKTKNIQNAKAAWVAVERVLTGGSWNPEFMPR